MFATLLAMPARRLASLVALTVTTLLAATPSASAAPVPLPRPDHVLVVVMENKDPGEVLNSRQAPYLTALAKEGASFTNAHAETHPSQPNYIALFSGSTQGVTDNDCGHAIAQPNLGSELIAAGHTFAGYAEALPQAGSTVCTAGRYARKHSPWVNFTNLPRTTTNLPASALTSWDSLPTVAFLTPDLCHDMHDCPVSTGDTWAKQHLDAYAQWAKAHNSLLIVTFDENDGRPDNTILTVFAGAGVKPGRYGEAADHYRVLRTIENFYGLPPLGNAAQQSPLTDVFTTAPAK